MSASNFSPGSARVSRAGEGVPRSRTFLERQHFGDVASFRKVRCGGTPQPARETRAIPGHQRPPR